MISEDMPHETYRREWPEMSFLQKNNEWNTTLENISIHTILEIKNKYKQEK
jgi:hypothetical protein